MHDKSQYLLTGVLRYQCCFPGDEEFTKYIGSADPLILRLRVEMLMQENCEEWALNLCNCCLKQRRYQMDLEFKSMQLLLLFKLGSMEKLQEVVSLGEQIPKRLELLFAFVFFL